MPQSSDTRYFIVKHGLDAFEALPNFIWNTRKPPEEIPRGYNLVRPGDEWIGFAYTIDDNREKPLSLVTGFYECVRSKEHRAIPAYVVPLPVYENKKTAWLIEGIPCGEQPQRPGVGVPPLADLLGRRMFNQQTIVPISKEEFDRIREYTRSHWLDNNLIPLLKREPRNEQEVLAVVVYGHQELGIEQIIRVGTAFPDMFVKIAGGPKEVHLELEVYSESFISHGHSEHVMRRKFKKDGLPVAVLCWIDNCSINNCQIENKPDLEAGEHAVHRVYELQSLIREKKKIVW